MKTLLCAVTVAIVLGVCRVAFSITIIVTNSADSGTGSSRQALADASDGDTIDATGISGAITLTSGQLLVNKGVRKPSRMQSDMRNSTVAHIMP
jgi:predicted transcriptional regulator